jgi:A/G-specific adenine glycosylase
MVLSVPSFQDVIRAYYREHRRDFPWRRTTNPYHILVSEIMLQQTQVGRVMDKYERFIAAFPDFESLARTSFKSILGIWQGLGYNRRALSLQRTAEAVLVRFHGILPSSVDELSGLPGIGQTTAGAILAFAFNLPAVFIETNIRRTFIYHFFQDHEPVRDKDILPLVEATLDVQNPRDWYYALMDYGSMLKKITENPNRRSLHYQKQAPFEDSDRMIRGLIVRILLEGPVFSRGRLGQQISAEGDRVESILAQMVKDGLIREEEGTYRIA